MYSTTLHLNFTTISCDLIDVCFYKRRVWWIPPIYNFQNMPDKINDHPDDIILERKVRSTPLFPSQVTHASLPDQELNMRGKRRKWRHRSHSKRRKRNLHSVGTENGEVNRLIEVSTFLHSSFDGLTAAARYDTPSQIRMSKYPRGVVGIGVKRSTLSPRK